MLKPKTGIDLDGDKNAVRNGIVRVCDIAVATKMDDSVVAYNVLMMEGKGMLRSEPMGRAKAVFIVEGE